MYQEMLKMIFPRHTQTKIYMNISSRIFRLIFFVFFLYSIQQQVVELNGYVIIVVEGRDNKIKLYGSPADRDNLEVGDEILDVNERKMEDLPRAEVIRYIHEVNN